MECFHIKDKLKIIVRIYFLFANYTINRESKSEGQDQSQIRVEFFKYELVFYRVIITDVKKRSFGLADMANDEWVRLEWRNI